MAIRSARRTEASTPSNPPSSGTLVPFSRALPGSARALLERLELGLVAREAADFDVVRACLCIAGMRLPLVGGLDARFEEAVCRFKRERGFGDSDAELDALAISAIVAAARRAVGGDEGPFRACRAAWFDALVLPHLVIQAPGVTALVRVLRR